MNATLIWGQCLACLIADNRCTMIRSDQLIHGSTDPCASLTQCQVQTWHTKTKYVKLLSTTASRERFGIQCWNHMRETFRRRARKLNISVVHIMCTEVFYKTDTSSVSSWWQPIAADDTTSTLKAPQICTYHMGAKGTGGALLSNELTTHQCFLSLLADSPWLRLCTYASCNVDKKPASVWKRQQWVRTNTGWLSSSKSIDFISC